MSAPRPGASPTNVRIRLGEPVDLDALLELEERAFTTDRMSRRSLRHFLRARSAAVIVADEGGRLAGTAMVLFRQRSKVARLYSIAVAPHMSGRGVAQKLLAAAENAARARRCRAIRLEVHVSNHPAISRYRKSGYREFGRYNVYYEDGGDALRFQKLLDPQTPGSAVPPTP